LNGKKNEIQLSGKGIENLLVNIVLDFFFLNIDLKKTSFHHSLRGNGVNTFWAKLLLDKILWDPITILPKLFIMNHHH
jgi:hypothetical protein